MGIGQQNNPGIGGLNDFVGVPYELGENSLLAFAVTGYYHVHGQAFVYPDHADDVLLTAGTGVWDLTGNITEIIPVDTIEDYAFDLHFIEVSNISGIGTVQIDIFKGASGSEVQIGATRANRSTNQTRNGPSRIQIPQQEAGERISCRLSDSTGGSLSCYVSFSGHYYAT